MQTERFNYYLPPEKIAQHPLSERNGARMMVLDRERKSSEDSLFGQIYRFLRRGDLLVLNNTRVFQARLRGSRVSTGGKIEVLLVRPWAGRLGSASGSASPGETAPGGKEKEKEPLGGASRSLGARWLALTRSGGKLLVGERLRLGGGALEATLVERLGNDGDVVEFNVTEGEFRELLGRVGETPLPPYIERARGLPGPDDKERYQTIFGKVEGAVAAPTAGLHFSEETFRNLERAGIEKAELTLHVGPGTFQPVKSDRIEGHAMGIEEYWVDRRTVRAVLDAKREGRRVIAVGTTSLRALETAFARGTIEGAAPRDLCGSTGLFVYPPYEFRVVNGLLTNFHLPRSTLLMLVCAFASPGRTDGIDWVLDRYEHAKQAGYRFYSYGDCMLLL